MTTFTVRQFVTLKSAKPLPNGTTKRLRCVVRWIENDGRFTIQSVTPGLYDGARFTVTADEIEAA